MKIETLEMMMKLSLCLPTTKEERDQVIQKVIAEYRKRYPTRASHEVSKTKQRRKAKGLSSAPVIHKHETKKVTAFTLPFD